MKYYYQTKFPSSVRLYGSHVASIDPSNANKLLIGSDNGYGYEVHECIYKPYWHDNEEDAIKHLEEQRNAEIKRLEEEIKKLKAYNLKRFF